LVKGSIGGVAATFQIQSSVTGNHITLRNGDPRYVVDYRLAMGFPDGVLTMLSVAGPVIWNGNFNRPVGMSRRMWTAIYRRPLSSFDLYRQRVKANLAAVRSLVRNSRKHVVPEEQTPLHISEVSIAWEKILGLIQPPLTE
jgi:NAD-dependent oxidoreductase involved in siderophore biosynthesis